MKKRTRIIGSTVLGIAAAAAVAAPAAATGPTITTDCADFQQQAVDLSGSAAHGGSNWYMDCIPQYGAGKAEFTISAGGAHSTATFPADFKPLTDSTVSITASVDSPPGAVEAYFGTTSPIDGFSSLTEKTADSTASSQTYEGTIVYRIASAQAVPLSDLPANCATTGDPYLSAWEVTYDPATVTYDQTVDGTKYDYTVTSSPKPLFLGLPFDPSNGNVLSTSPTASLCASDGTNLIQEVGTSDSEKTILILEYEGAALPPVPPFNETTESSLISQLGTFAPTSAKPTPVKPPLATTGIDPVPGGLLGVGLVIIGGVAVMTRRQRRRT